MRWGTNRDEREREWRVIPPLRRQKHPRGTPSAGEHETTALVHSGKMRGPGDGFPEMKHRGGNIVQNRDVIFIFLPPFFCLKYLWPLPAPYPYFPSIRSSLPSLIIRSCAT